MMLLGMALFKWGLLDCSRTARVYGAMALAGLCIGLPINTWETLAFVNSGFHFEWAALNRPTYDLGTPFSSSRLYRAHHADMQERRFKEDAATIVEGWADGSYKLPFSLIDMQFYIYGLGAWVSWGIT